MKLNINKACDLGSISVLPPHSRRMSAMPPGPQTSQYRSEQSQQSFSQGISSQHGLFSQFSQTSLDEATTKNQRFSSQERENYLKKNNCLPSVMYAREESQMPISRSSTSVIRKLNPPVADHKCQINKELEDRIGAIETSLNKFGWILDSVQSCVMQANKGTKEVLLEVEGVQQKLTVLDTSLQLAQNKGQDDVKSCLGESLKSLSQQLSKDAYQDKLQQSFLATSALPQRVEASLLRLQTEILKTFTKEMQAMARSLKPLNQKSPVITVLQPKVTGSQATPQRKPEPLKNGSRPAMPPKIEMGGWNSVKREKDRIMRPTPYKEQTPNVLSSVQQERQHRLTSQSDEEIDGGFSCLIDENDTGTRSYMVHETEEEIELNLRKARRRKRRYTDLIIID